jgi:hypothetical protein
MTVRRIRLFALTAASMLLVGWAGASSFAGATGATGAVRSVPLRLSPAPADVSLVAIRFPRSGGLALGARSLRVTLSGPFGADFLALALPRRNTHRAALLLLANRPSALLDPATVHLRVRSSAQLGAPLMRRQDDPLSRSVTHPNRALCNLSRAGAPLAASSLRALGTRGAQLAGFSAAGAVAQAYDAACGLPYAAGFKQAVAGSGPGCATGSSCEPTPVPAPPTPLPPGPPRCTPCNPAPGIACPLSAREAVCVASKDEAAPAAGAGAH